MDCPPLCPPWALFSCCSRRSSWKTRELFSVPRASNIVCFWISVSVSWWRRFSSSVWLLLIVLFVNWRKEQSEVSNSSWKGSFLQKNKSCRPFPGERLSLDWTASVWGCWPGSWVFGFHPLDPWFCFEGLIWCGVALPLYNSAPMNSEAHQTNVA